MLLQNNLLLFLIPLVAGYLLDLMLGDPRKLPHPIVYFGKLIDLFDKGLNRGKYRILKGLVTAIVLPAIVFVGFYFLMKYLADFPSIYLGVASIFVFFGLANKSLILEGLAVIQELSKNGLEAGRKRLSWIVGRETDQLSPHQIITAVFETLSENLSDGVIAPLFYYAIGGVPGMMTYKMINTLDSMIGYRFEKYEKFGKVSARLDDIANYIPARITAFFMVLISFSFRGIRFIFKYGHQHKSPNSGYPESALAGILDCRFGGPNYYHGKLLEKPYIGENKRDLKPEEIKKVARINHLSTLVCVVVIGVMAKLFC